MSLVAQVGNQWLAAGGNPVGAAIQIADKTAQYTRIRKNSSIAWTPIVIVTQSASLNIPKTTIAGTILELYYIELYYIAALSLSMHGNKEYTYSRDLPGRVVKGD